MQRSEESNRDNPVYTLGQEGGARAVAEFRVPTGALSLRGKP